MPFVELSAVTKAFDGVTVINQVDCGVEKGEFFCILGPSGCGKSTLLRLIAGLEKLDAGAIAIGGNAGQRFLGSMWHRSRATSGSFSSPTPCGRT